MSGLVDRRGVLALGVSGASALALPGWAQTATAPAAAPIDAAIDGIVARFMRAFETPGIGVAIVRKGAAPWLKGYGVRTLGKAAAVDVHTRFGIASNSKAFTAAALAMLVEAGKTGWDDPLVRHLPEFRMADPAVTQLFTVRDLLVHRSGLPLGAGDLMYFPRSSADAAQVVRALQYLKPVRGFRTGYDYDNILYIVAGVLIERLSGMRWRQFVQRRLLTPLGMADAVPSRELLRSGNVAGRHARLGPPVRGMGPLKVIAPDESPLVDAGAGINASVSDIANWLQAQLALGEFGGQRLWSAASAAEMWKPQVVMSSSDGATEANPARAVMAGYALGWQVQDYRGRRLISHSGGLSGQVTQTAMIPAAGIGVAVFSNVEDGVSGGIRNAILDQLLGVAPAYDWVASHLARNKAAQDNAVAQMANGASAKPAGGPSLPLAAYAGRYRDAWYGDIVVSMQRETLRIDFVPTPQFSSVLEPWGTDAFRTRMTPGVGEDAVVTFAVKDGKVTGVRMKALSPLADFSYDFHHLDFAPVGS